MSALPIPGPDQRTDDWFSLRVFDPERKDRPFVFGASEAGAICGVSSYSTPLQIFLEKRGMGPPRDDTDAMRLGRKLEPVVLSEYAERMLVDLEVDQPMYFSAVPGRWWEAASPDAKVIGRPMLGVDAKTSTWRMLDRTGQDQGKFGEEGTDQVPIDQLFQAQQLCSVMGWEGVDFPLLLDNRTLRIYHVDRNDDLIASIVSAEQELAERIIANDPPEPTWQHSSTRSLLRRLYGFTAGKQVELSEAARAHWLNAQRLNDEIQELSAKRDEYRNRVLAELADAETGTFPNGTKEIVRVQVRASSYTVQRKAHEQLRERKSR